MRIIESFVEGKRKDPSLCEDVLVLGPRFLGVVDGVTSLAAPTGPTSPGRAAALAVARVFERLPARASAQDAARAATDAVRRIRNTGFPGAACVYAVYSVARREIWRVGDCGVRIGRREHLFGMRCDDENSRARSALLKRLLAEGRSVEDLLADDPGRRLIAPRLAAQRRLANTRSHRLSYAAVNGREIPARFLAVFPAGPAPTEICLASDGYPRVLPTLAASEAHLARLIAEDPLMIGRHPTTKGVLPGFASFDDRAYLRFRA